MVRTNRAGGITAGVLALVVGGYQAWAAFHVKDVASTYSDGLGFLVRGDTHYTKAFHDFVVWVRTEAALSGAAAIALLSARCCWSFERPPGGD
jgi:hypothetical protein